MRSKLTPFLLLYFLSPMIGELLTGSSPPKAFFSPFGLTMMVLLYGGGANLVRELAFRWNKGWPTIIALGAAYGIIEEGIMCKSFFDPNWPDLLSMHGYGRFAGVNWVWTLGLIIFHSLVSISTPIFLVNMVFPDRVDESWITKTGFKAISVLFTINMVLCFLLITPYRPPVLHIVITVACVAGLYRFARGLPKSLPAPAHERTYAPHPLWLGAIGASSWILFYGISGLCQHLGVNFAVSMLATSAVVLSLGLLVWRWANTETGLPTVMQQILGVISICAVAFFISLGWLWLAVKLKAYALLMVIPALILIRLAGRQMWRLSTLVTEWSDMHPLALISGSLGLLGLFAILCGFRIIHLAKDPTGMQVVGILTLVGLVWLTRLVKRRQTRVLAA